MDACINLRTHQVCHAHIQTQRHTKACTNKTESSASSLQMRGGEILKEGEEERDALELLLE